MTMFANVMRGLKIFLLIWASRYFWRNNHDFATYCFPYGRTYVYFKLLQGYVKNTMSKGCFIMLSRTLEAKVLLSNLCDTFVKDPEKEFPVGKLVTGR